MAHGRIALLEFPRKHRDDTQMGACGVTRRGSLKRKPRRRTKKAPLSVVQEAYGHGASSPAVPPFTSCAPFWGWGRSGRTGDGSSPGAPRGRVYRGIGRRCNVVRLFPSASSALRLSGAVGGEQRAAWLAVRRCFSAGSMAALYERSGAPHGIPALGVVKEAIAG